MIWPWIIVTWGLLGFLIWAILYAYGDRMEAMQA